MRWRKKKITTSCTVHKKNKNIRRLLVSMTVFVIIFSITLVVSKVSMAAADAELDNEIKQFNIARNIKSCRFAIRKTTDLGGEANNGFLSLSKTALDKVGLYQFENPMGPSATGRRTIIPEPGIDDRPYSMGQRNPDKRTRIGCDIIDLASQNGQGEFFAKYFKEHANINDNGNSYEKDPSDAIFSRDHSAQRAKEELNKNNMRDFSIKVSLVADAIDAYPVPTLSDGAKAEMYWEAIQQLCSDKQPPFTESDTGEYTYATQGDDGKYTVKKGHFEWSNSATKGREISVWTGHKDSPTGSEGSPDMTCEEAVKRYSELAKAHADALNKHIKENPDDSKNKDDHKDENECAAELNGFGSIICSGQNLFVTITQILFDTVSKILESQAELTKEDAVRQQWGNLLNVANAILIIAFLVVIYSTATSTGGLSNYDVKKLLPKIIIFAIAINLSYYICMALVDLSNILGHGIFGLFLGGKTGDAPQLMKTAKATADAISIPPEVGAITTVAIVAILIFLVGPPIIIALLTILFALVVRGMALMILVIISPVAIASYLFNSQGLSKGFTMWRDNYIKLLLVYPLFMLVWAGSRVVSSLNPNSPDPTLAIFGLLMEVICLVAPAMSILPLFKMSGDIMGKATIAAQNNRGANKFAGWAGSKFTGKPGDPNSPGLRSKAAGVIGAAAGAAAGRAAGAVQNMRGAGASTGNIATQLDSQAMNSARNKVNKYGDRDLKTAFTTGQIGGKTLDPYQMRAVIEKELPNASAAEIKQSMQAVNTEADKLRRNGQAADADRLVQTFANTASANGNSIMSGKSLRNFATSGGWNTSQFEANYADAVADYSSTQLTAKDAAGMDAADLIQMRTTLQNARVNGGNIAQADAGLSSMAKQSNIALSDPKLTRKMNAPTVTALKDNTMVRSTAGERLANTHKIPNIYHDYNAGGTTSAQAISDARTMMAHTDFGRLDAIDQSRLRAIARASAPVGTGAPAAPVVIASWDSRVP